MMRTSRIACQFFLSGKTWTLSEASHCLPSEDFWKCHAAGWPWYIPEDVACGWGTRGWSSI